MDGVSSTVVTRGIECARLRDSVWRQVSRRSVLPAAQEACVLARPFDCQSTPSCPGWMSIVDASGAAHAARLDCRSRGQGGAERCSVKGI